MTRFLLLTVAVLICAGCSSGRPPVPPGTVPQQTTLAAEDEQYGHQVLSSLTEQFPLDTDDNNINRVRDITDRLAMASGNTQTPWHVHVLKDDSVKNAAATRGNYLFVWTGMFLSVRDDTELATVIAHEMGHLLAGHTAASPEQEAAQILSGIMGVAASSALSIQGYGGFSNLAQVLVENVIQAALLNPQSQSDELEADHIGLFLMADSGYNPDDALEFWKRVQSDPDFQSSSLAFFSSHPSTLDRIQSLTQYIETARNRYQLALGQKPNRVANPSPIRETATSQEVASVSPKTPLDEVEGWMVATAGTRIFSDSDAASSITGTLAEGQMVSGKLIKRRWVQIVNPSPGFVRSADLSPLK